MTRPKIQTPLTLSGGDLVTFEQDTDADISQCVRYILLTPVGSRNELPEFGTIDQTFAETVRPELITAALERWEPRVSWLVRRGHEVRGDELTAFVEAQYEGVNQ